MKTILLHLSHSKPKEYNLSDGDKLIVRKIMNYDKKVLQDIYKEYFNKIEIMVKKFGNRNLEAEDIFQEGLTRAVINIRNNKFKGDSSFLTYLNRICYNICLKEFNYDKQPEVNPVQDEINYELLDRVLVIKNKLDKKCQKIIDLRFDIGENSMSDGNDKLNSFDKIANLLGITPSNARKRIGRCLTKLKELVRNDSELKDHME